MNNLFYSISSNHTEYSVMIKNGLRYRLENKCPHCGLSTVTPLQTKGHEEVFYPQKKWPDTFLGFTSAAIFSENVISALHASGISCFRAIPFTIHNVPKTKDVNTQYYYFQPTTIVNFDVLETKYTKPYICPYCMRFYSHKFYTEYSKEKIHVTYRFRESEYNGEEFILARLGGRECFPYCTEHFIDMCHKNKWTNFIFKDTFSFYQSIIIRHTLPNWRELLEQDIAREEARLRGENPDPIQISVPAMPPRKTSPKPVSDHPFDNLSEFDGTAWQGTDSLPWAFGLYDFIVYEDENAESEVENEDDDLPTKGQRALFDYFRSIQEALLPQLYDVLMKGLQKIGILFTARIASYADLAQVLDSGDLEIRNTSPRGKGILSLGYSTKDKKHDLIVRIACTPSRKLFRVLSCRGE